MKMKFTHLTMKIENLTLVEIEAITEVDTIVEDTEEATTIDIEITMEKEVVIILTEVEEGANNITGMIEIISTRKPRIPKQIKKERKKKERM